ncbi:MAG: RnfH family protein [Burkholderiaceae bacterium]|nr:RnfH family protein [Burkholderiaceae bacterium]
MPETPIDVELAWACDGEVRVEALRVEAGSTIAQALAVAVAAGLPIDLCGSAVSVFGRPRPQGFVLTAGDRVELTGSLRVDPKIARRQRASHRRAGRERERSLKTG